MFSFEDNIELIKTPFQEKINFCTVNPFLVIPSGSKVMCIFFPHSSMYRNLIPNRSTIISTWCRRAPCEYRRGWSFPKTKKPIMTRFFPQDLIRYLHSTSLFNVSIFIIHTPLAFFRSCPFSTFSSDIVNFCATIVEM